ncbi:MAG TPA: phosphoenolpyruvate carboxylase [Caulobacteraceae bacterium]|jgi:phosphoenolpyruvate carboxylase|nr:phosphoenolpyruvate carboxylase [Caulobacteraceae bacterium]
MTEQDARAQAPLKDRLAADLAARRAAAAADPFANPILAFARDLAGRLNRGELALPDLAGAVQALTVEGFSDRAERLGAYLGAGDPDSDRAALEVLFEGLAEGGFEAYRTTLARPAFGVVFTGHPTFSLTHDLSLALVELGLARDLGGRPLDEAGRAARLDLARRSRHRPPEPLTIDLEHAWSVQALENAADALDVARRAALTVGRRRWPDRWRELVPKLATLATWVGFDTDGRTDVTWLISLEKRLDLKRRALQRCRRALAGLGGVGEATALLDNASGAVADQLALAGAAKDDPREIPHLARVLVAGSRDALVDPAPLLDLLQRAAAKADDETCERLMIAHAAVATQGLSLAQVHVRLNAGQLHSAIRGQIDLPTEPGDPANRRAYFAAAEKLLRDVKPQTINFGSLVDEPAPAKRLMMTIAQTAKHVDATNPTRFLIAECESGFTLLAALYYARLFGVEDKVEISPLFETEEGFERGERVFEEAMKSRHYCAHLKRQGRLAVEFGFSDSGRFIGQMAATFQIERLQLRIAELVKREGLAELEVVLFDTHGESIGRGGHPASLGDRLRYVAPPRARAEFAERGIALREETSFQGGEGYLLFFTPSAALATVRGVLAFAYGPEPEAVEGADPIYAAPEFASDFFAAIEQAFTALVDDRDYVALLGLFGTRMLQRTGSRPEQRQNEGQTGPHVLRHVGELRAIPNNGVLHQLGWLANTLEGVGLAAARDTKAYAALFAASPRFRRALQMAEAAFHLSSLNALFAYAEIMDPALWLASEAGAQEADRRAFESLAAVADKAGLHEPLERVLRRLQGERLRLTTVMGPSASARRDRLLLLHAIRAGVLQRIARLAAEIPAFNPQHGLDRAAVQERLMRLDIPGAVATLSELFPLTESAPLRGADWGEPASYRADVAHGHAREHETLFQPLLRLHELALDITSAVNHEVGACG